MDRHAFKERLKLYKEAKEQNPLLKYYEFKLIPKYGDGTEYIKSDEFPIWDNTLLFYRLYHDSLLNKKPFTQRQSFEDYMSSRDDAITNYRKSLNNKRINPELAQIQKDIPFEGNMISEREKYANAYKIPFIPEKEIMLSRGRFNTGRISENVLDSIYDASLRTNTPFKDALGLAARESGIGYARGFKQRGYINGTDLYSNWLQIHKILNTNSEADKYNDINRRYYNGEPISKDDIEFYKLFRIDRNKEMDSMKPLTENPIDNALKLFKSGKYNPNDPTHTIKSKADGRLLITDPAIKKWAKKRGVNLNYDKGTGFIGIPDKGTPKSLLVPEMAHRWDTPETFIDRMPFDSPYDDPRWFADPKPRFEFRKGLEIPARYTPKYFNTFMGKAAKGTSVAGLLLEAGQQLFPSKEEESYESLRLKISDINKQLLSNKINTYSEGTDGIAYSINLPEIPIYPSNEQIQFQLNIKDKLLRKNIIKDIDLHYILREAIKDVYENKGVPEGYKSVFDYIAKNKYNLYEENNINNKIVNALGRFNNIYEIAGKPELTGNDSFIVNKLGGLINSKNKNRPNINPFTNKAYNIKNLSNAVAELSHPIQYKYGRNKHGFLDLIRFNDDPYNYKEFYKSRYNNPKALEWETHSMFEPKIEKYIYNENNSNIDDAIKYIIPTDLEYIEKEKIFNKRYNNIKNFVKKQKTKNNKSN